MATAIVGCTWTLLNLLKNLLCSNRKVSRLRTTWPSCVSVIGRKFFFREIKGRFEPRYRLVLFITPSIYWTGVGLTNKHEGSKKQHPILATSLLASSSTYSNTHNTFRFAFILNTAP